MGFDLLAQYDIPYLHPLAVHFPLVLLLVGAAAGAGYALRGTAAWRWAALGLVGLGALGAWAAHRTGGALGDAVEGSPVVSAVIEAHKTSATATAWTATLAALGYAGLSVALGRRPPAAREPLAGRLLALVPAAAAAALVAWTGHLGAIMTWGVPAPL